jgi:hypothetical protein
MRTGSSRGRPDAASPSFGSPIPSTYCEFTVTVRPREFAFSHQAQTSSAIAITPASI